MKGDTVNILLVEDDEVDLLAVRRAFREMRVVNPVTTAYNGIEALECLRGENGRPKVPSPCLILLDLNMPCMGGIEFLEVMRHDTALQRSIVFVLTTSGMEEDRTRAYNLHVAGYVLKDRVDQSFNQAIGMLEHYWRIIEFPD
jgi:CheY-like chemotaxis protein